MTSGSREPQTKELMSSFPSEAGEFRFKAGDVVWVRDVGSNGYGYKLTKATVRDQHYHPDRHPGYPNGEGYTLDGELWWDCYPGCRVFASREEAAKARIPKY